MNEKTIWKFPLRVTDMNSVDMPLGAEILCVQAQREAPTLWALCDPAAPKRTRYFVIYGTGHPVDASDSAANYVGTIQQYDGALVWHVFEVQNGGVR
jgi:hypothetical protein